MRSNKAPSVGRLSPLLGTGQDGGSPWLLLSPVSGMGIRVPPVPGAGKLREGGQGAGSADCDGPVQQNKSV